LLAQVPDPLNVNLKGSSTDWLPLAAVGVAALGLIVALVVVWRQNRTSKAIAQATVEAQRLQWRRDAALDLYRQALRLVDEIRDLANLFLVASEFLLDPATADSKPLKEKAKGIQTEIREGPARKLRYIEAEFRALGFPDLAESTGNLRVASHVTVLMGEMASGPIDSAREKLAENRKWLDSDHERNWDRLEQAAAKEFGR